MGIEAPPRALYIRTDAHRAVAHRDVPAVPRRDGPAGRRDHARVLRVPRPRVRAQPHRGRHRRPLPPQLQPHRRHQGRPARGAGSPSAARRCRRCSRAATVRGPRARQPDLRAAHPFDRHHPAPSSAPRTACRVRTSARRASTGTSAATASRTSRTTSSTGRSGRTPTATRSRATGCACRRRASRRAWCCSCSTDCPSGPIMAKVPRIIKVPEGEVWVNTENPLGEMGYYVVSKGATGPVPREDPLRVVQQRLDPAVDAQAASTFPTSSRSSPASTSSSGDIDR